MRRWFVPCTFALFTLAACQGGKPAPDDATLNAICEAGQGVEAGKYTCHTTRNFVLECIDGRWTYAKDPDDTSKILGDECVVKSCVKKEAAVGEPHKVCCQVAGEEQCFVDMTG